MATMGECFPAARPRTRCIITATSFGRPVRNAGPVDAGKVNSIGFLLADKKAGPFKLEVEWIKVLRAAADE